jgi:predicted acylesterase/phospholipase RssA
MAADELLQLLLASSALPHGVFPPITRPIAQYVDGGLADNLPVYAALVTRSDRASAAIGAGALCGLAILTKETALWAPAAIVIWLLLSHRRRAAAATVGSLALVLAAGLLAAEAASHGRFSDNLIGLSGSSFEGLRSVVLDSPDKLLGLAQGSGSSLVIRAF